MNIYETFVSAGSPPQTIGGKLFEFGWFDSKIAKLSIDGQPVEIFQGQPYGDESFFISYFGQNKKGGVGQLSIQYRQIDCV